jgi:hypothetical protein
MSRCLCNRLTVNGNCTACGLNPPDCECQSIDVCLRCEGNNPTNKFGLCGKCEEVMTKA